MWSNLKSLINKSNSGKLSTNQAIDNEIAFKLSVDNITIGKLSHKENQWIFQYSEEFKSHLDEYNLIIGFPEVNKIYKSEVLWPFFKIRIPGLKQPAIKEILAKEKINKNDEIGLLKYFGGKSIANPYELDTIL